MKRSQINRVIDELIEVADREGFKLPPFAGWSPDEMVARRTFCSGSRTARVTGRGKRRASKNSRTDYLNCWRVPGRS